jgi:hypothetical protein
MRNRRYHRISKLAMTWGLLLALVVPALAGSGDKAGWSTDVDSRKRAFLKYVAADDGPRLLVLGCLRDVDSFIVLSEELTDARPADNVTLTLANGQARYSVQGRIEPDGISGKLGFTFERDANSKVLRAIRTQLLPVLDGKGAIRLTAGPLSRELPVSGLGAPVKRFKSVCFSG